MSGSNRRQPARSARTSVARPTNYYQRPYGNAPNPAMEEDAAPEPPGFFPGITHFTDGIAALPKEVMRYFTLLRETEGKAFQPDQAIGELVSQIATLPDPPKEMPQQQAAFMAFSMSNSVNPSANVSMIDGHEPSGNAYQSDFDSNRPHPHAIVDQHSEARRRTFGTLRERLREMISILDEKNMMLSSANEALSRQLLRLDSAIPVIEEEVSEEARLGSKTHWALYDMQQLRKAAPNERSKVDRQGANSLVAAAAALQEADQSRSEARREAVQAKKRTQKTIEADFPEQIAMRKVNGQTNRVDVKNGVNSSAATQANKRRKVDKAIVPPMERTASTATLNGRGRDVTNDPAKKKLAKPLPAPASRKRNVPQSPSLASSPTRGTFLTTHNPREYSPAPPMSRMASSRGRRNSNQSLRPSTSDSRGRPVSSTHIDPKQNNGTTQLPKRESYKTMPEEPITMRNGQNTSSWPRRDASTNGGQLKVEDAEMSTDPAGLSSVPMAQTRSRTGARPTHHSSGPVGNQGTPVNAAGPLPSPPELAAPLMSRSRSARAAASVLTNNAAVVGGGPPSGVSALGGDYSLKPTGSDTPKRTGESPSRTTAQDDEDDGDNTLEAEPADDTISPIHNHAAAPNQSALLPPPPPRRSRSPRRAPDLTRNITQPSTSALSSSPPLPSRSPSPSRFGIAAIPGTRTRPHAPDYAQANAHAMPAPTSSPGTVAAEPASSSPPPHLYPTAASTNNPTSTHPHTTARPALDAPSDAEGEPEGDPEANEDEDDPNEPRYCTCGQISYGDMIACDNDGCAREWFHLACVGLARAPRGNAKWFCEECREILGGGVGIGVGGAGVGGGTGSGSGNESRGGTARGRGR